MKKLVSYGSFVNESKLQNDYRDFFSNVLKLYGVKSPASFKADQEEGKKFYADIKKGWNNGEGISQYGKELLAKLEEKPVEESVEQIVEGLDGEELLSAKQKKLPEGLKKGIIARMKKSGKKSDDKEDDKDDKKCDDKKCDDKKDDKDDKDDKKSGSDEEKYLSAKQRKLPEGMKKSIIAKAKKKGKVNESNQYTLPSELWDDCISKFLEVSRGYSEANVDVTSSNVVTVDCENRELIDELIAEFEQINPNFVCEYNPLECTITIDEN